VTSSELILVFASIFVIFCLIGLGIIRLGKKFETFNFDHHFWSIFLVTLKIFSTFSRNGSTKCYEFFGLIF